MVSAMFIWILAVVLLAIFAGLGYLKGAIRTVVSTLGLLLGLILAKPLAPTVRPILPSLGVKNPLWLDLLPPGVVLLLVWLVAIGISFAVHRKAYLYYKYKADDVTRLRWERMNHRIGLCVGVFSGVVYFFIFSWIIYVAGYLTVQVSAEDNNPAVVKFLNKGREDLKSTGLDRAISAVDKTSPWFYNMSDILGLIYNNPVLQSRLSKYPPFLTLGERPEFIEIANDKEFSEMLLNKGSVAAIIDHPKFQSLISNQALMDELKQIDLTDLRHYLETGKSAKYDDEKLLGRWTLDPEAVVTAVRKTKPDMSAPEMAALRKEAVKLAGLTMTATVEGKLLFKTDTALQAAAAAEAGVGAGGAAAGGNPANPPGGRRPGPPGARQSALPKPAVAAPTIAVPGGEGTWKFDGEKYSLTITVGRNQETFNGNVEDGELIVTKDDKRLIFYKAE